MSDDVARVAEVLVELFPQELVRLVPHPEYADDVEAD